jgi:hypothetical protein
VEVFEDWFGSDDLKRRVAELGTRVDRDALPDRTRAALEAAEKYASCLETHLSTVKGSRS